MKLFGTILLIGAVIICIYSLTMETTVKGGYTTYDIFGFPTYHEAEVHNVGLLNNRQNLLILSGILALIGTLMCTIKPKRKENHTQIQPNESYLDLLNKRLITGEITLEDYNKIRKEINI